MLSTEDRVAVRDAFLAGTLRVSAVDPSTGRVGQYVVKDVLVHTTPHKEMVRTRLVDGREVCTTVDHSLFYRSGDGIVPTEAGSLRAGDWIAVVGEGDMSGEVSWAEVQEVELLPPQEHTYDLFVPGPENFRLANGILAHNSYSIGGISLDLERSSKYMDLKRNAEEQWDKLTTAKQQTTMFLRGLKQPKFGMGVRSAFGPHTGRGTVSPRSFL